MIRFQHVASPQEDQKGKTLLLHPRDPAGGRQTEGRLPSLPRIPGDDRQAVCGERAAGRPERVAVREFGSLFLAHEIEKRLNTIGLIDGIVPRAARETGPSVGEYFFFAWANRLIDPRSKRALPDWYRGTAVSEIRPVPVEELSSQRYWEKWDRVSPEAVEAIGKEFFARLWSMQPAPPECLLFDTTNYYTYMSSPTESDLCARGHNKDGKHHLRQVGLALLVDRDTELPLFYRVYEGNTHD